MNNANASQEIADLNLNYVLLAQKLLRQDRASAMLRLGISGELADLLVRMTLAQIVKLANTNVVLCSFRLENANLVQDAKSPSLQQAHINIVFASARSQPRVAMAT